MTNETHEQQIARLTRERDEYADIAIVAMDRYLRWRDYARGRRRQYRELRKASAENNEARWAAVSRAARLAFHVTRLWRERDEARRERDIARIERGDVGAIAESFARQLDEARRGEQAATEIGARASHRALEDQAELLTVRAERDEARRERDTSLREELALHAEIVRLIRDRERLARIVDRDRLVIVSERLRRETPDANKAGGGV